MFRLLLLASVCLAPALLRAQVPVADTADSKVKEEIRRTLRQYDADLQRRDTQAVARHWAEEYTFVNPAGERVARAARLANLQSGRTTFDTLRPKIQDEQIRLYGDVAVYTTLITLAGRYSGRAHQGDYQALVVLVKRDDRWQQVASQLTAVKSK